MEQFYLEQSRIQIFRKNSVSLMQNAGKLLEDNEYLYGIILKGRYSTVMDDAAYRAHQGMTANGAHSKHPPCG